MTTEVVTSSLIRDAVVVAVSTLGLAALWWVAVVVSEFFAARARSDGRKDWQDLFWPKMLARLDRERYERTRRKLVDPDPVADEDPLG